MDLLNVLFWIFIIYLVTRLIRFSFFIGKIQNQAHKNYQSSDDEIKKEGTTTVKYIPDNEEKANKSSSSKDDDYIEYEEIK